MWLEAAALCMSVHFCGHRHELAPLQRWPICNILAISICSKLEMWIQSVTCGPSMLWQNLSLVTCSSTAATKLGQVLHHMDIFAAAAASFAVAVAVSTYSVKY